MKKRLLTVPLALALLLSLAACGPKEGSGGGGGEKNGGRAPGALPDKAVQALTEQGFQAAEPAQSPQRTIEELIQAVKDGEPMTDPTGAPYASMAAEAPALPSMGEGAAPRGETVIVPDEPWETEKTVEVTDWKAQMTPEARAEFEEMENMTEEDWNAMIAETEAMMEEFETMDMGDVEGDGDLEDFEAPGLEDFEMPDPDGVDIPDEYRQYLPEGFDMGSYLP